MSESKDRRYIDRIMIPGAKLYYKKSSRFTYFKRYRGPLYLADITKSTISVPEKLSLHIKTDLDLKDDTELTQVQCNLFYVALSNVNWNEVIIELEI